MVYGSFKTRPRSHIFNQFTSEVVYTHAIFCWNGRSEIRDRLNAHSDFCVFWPGALSTRHPWRAIVRADVYTRKCFLESMGSLFGSPRQKAINEFTLFLKKDDRNKQK